MVNFSYEVSEVGNLHIEIMQICKSQGMNAISIILGTYISFV